VRTHIRPERILECPTASCPFVTEYRHHLELHLRNHLNSRPIRCPICPYRCAVSSMLASHLKSHTKVHRFRCSVCRFSSKFSNALKRHLLEKGHGRGYVLNPDGSIPEGGAVPFEPGSPTARLRPKVTNTTTAKTSTAMAGTAASSSEAQRKPTRSADVTSEVALMTGADIKAAIWTPPVVSTSHELRASPAGKANWRPMDGGEEPVKRSPPGFGTFPVAEPQTAVSVPLLPSLPAALLAASTTAGSRRARSLYACAVCGMDAGGYVELARHMMTSHYSAMTSAPERQAAAGAASALVKRRWPASDHREPGVASWTSLPPPPPSSGLPPPRPSNASQRDRSDDGRQFQQPAFPVTSIPLFQQPPPPPPGWESYRFLPPVSTAFGSLRTLRAEFDAMRSSDRSRAGESFRMSADRSVQHDIRLKSAKSDVDDASRRPNPPPSNYRYADVNSPHQRRKTQPQNDPFVEHVVSSLSAPVDSGLPLDLSAKTSTTPRCDPFRTSAFQSEAKRSRRKGKAFKVDADMLNSGSRDDDPVDGDAVPATKVIVGPWRSSDELDTAGRGAGGGMQALSAGQFSSDRDDANVGVPTVPRPVERQWFDPGRERRSDGAAQGQTSATPAAADTRSTAAPPSPPYHECRYCGLGFRDAELYAMHMDFHGRQDPFTCNFCGAATENQVEFFLHVAHAPHNVRPVYVM